MKKSRQFWPVQFHSTKLKHWFVLRFSRAFGFLCLQTLVFQLQNTASHNVHTVHCTVEMWYKEAVHCGV